MTDSSQPQLFLDDQALTVPLPGAMQRVSLWLFGGLGGAALGALLIVAVATQSSADAERIASSDSTGLSVIVSAIAATHGRPGAL